jgi:Uma2 family endonuclease
MRSSLDRVLIMTISNLQPPSLKPTIWVPNAWVTASWEEFVAISESPDQIKSSCYYYQHRMRIETMGVGPNHAIDNTLIMLAIGLFCMAKGIPVRGLTNASYRRTVSDEAQPDLSYYFGDKISSIPETNSLLDLQSIAPPDLAIEIAASSLSDDLGTKRSLYQELGVSEYWVVNVETASIVAFNFQADNPQIRTSLLLPGLEISVLEQALRDRTTQDDSQIMAILLKRFQE